jgi:hypothetical protein
MIWPMLADVGCTTYLSHTAEMATSFQSLDGPFFASVMSILLMRLLPVLVMLLLLPGPRRAMPAGRWPSP